jgi:hypothetical protein
LLTKLREIPTLEPIGERGAEMHNMESMKEKIAQILAENSFGLGRPYVLRVADEIIEALNIRDIGAHIVCLCGSTRFSEEYQQANLEETLAGHIVLTIGCDMKSDHDIFEGKTEEELASVKAHLDELHRKKIALADEILVVSRDFYIGESTAQEIQYAQSLGKRVCYYEEERGNVMSQKPEKQYTVAEMLKMPSGMLKALVDHYRGEGQQLSMFGSNWPEDVGEALKLAIEAGIIIAPLTPICTACFDRNQMGAPYVISQDAGVFSWVEGDTVARTICMMYVVMKQRDQDLPVTAKMERGND